MYRLTYSEKFKKHYKNLQIDEKKQIKKKIKGAKGLFEFSVNMDIRIIWYYEKEQIILLADIGHHDILSRL